MTAHNGSLDVLRALAIAMVLACHAVSAFLPGTPLASVASLGGRGVDLFFVLSGWLLGRQLFREIGASNTINLKRFWFRRWMRTLPAYYAMLLAICAWLLVQGKGHLIDWRYFVFSENYMHDLPFFGVSWSLCVEEHFYLVVAPAILLLWRTKAAWLIVLAAFSLATTAEYRGWYPVPLHSEFETYATHIRAQACGVGVLLAWLAVRRPTVWSKCCRLAWLPFLASLICIALSMLNRTVLNWTLPEWPTLGWGLIFGSWVLLAESTPFFRERINWSLARFVALRAYSLYLVHTEAIAVAKRIDAGPEMKIAIALLVGFAMAEVLYRLIERPFTRMRDRDASAKRR